MNDEHRISSENRASNIRVVRGLFAVLIAAFFLLVGRCFYLQCVKSGYYLAQCDRQQEAVAKILPQRGAILDCRGRMLAGSKEIQTVFAEPRILEDPKETSNQLAPILEMGPHIICKIITDSDNPGFVKIKVGVDSNQASAVKCRAWVLSLTGSDNIPRAILLLRLSVLPAPTTRV